MKKNIVGLPVVVLILLGTGGLKAQNDDCADPSIASSHLIYEDGGKNLKANRKITLVNNLDEGVSFLSDLKDDKGITHSDMDVNAHGTQIYPYCLFWKVDGNTIVADITGWLLERDFFKDEVPFDKTKIKPLNWTDTFKKLEGKKSFNLVITINKADKDPVIEIK